MIKKGLLSLILSTFIFFTNLYSSEIKVPFSLKDLKEVKVVFDLNVGKPQQLLLRLKLIEETLIEISKYANYTAVIAVRGEASDFMTKSGKYVSKEALPIKKEIQDQMKKLKERYQIKIEQCQIALKLRQIDPKDVYDFIELIENGYISLIGYQLQGYAYIPMD